MTVSHRYLYEYILYGFKLLYMTAPAPFITDFRGDERGRMRNNIGSFDPADQSRTPGNTGRRSQVEQLRQITGGSGGISY